MFVTYSLLDLFLQKFKLLLVFLFGDFKNVFSTLDTHLVNSCKINSSQIFPQTRFQDTDLFKQISCRKVMASKAFLLVQNYK